MQKFKINDRVRRLPFTVTLPVESDDSGIELNNGEAPVVSTSLRGCHGTVKTLREETTSSSQEAKERSIMIHVMWDNGTLSYLGPEGLELVK